MGHKQSGQDKKLGWKDVTILESCTRLPNHFAFTMEDFLLVLRLPYRLGPSRFFQISDTQKIYNS